MTPASYFRLTACLALCLMVGGVTGRVTAVEIPTWYAGLVKPSWSPPNFAFPVVWTLLYVLMGISLWLLWERGRPGPARTKAIQMFFFQLALNAAWSPVFFKAHEVFVAVVIIMFLNVAIAATIVCAWSAQRTAAWLLAPYLAWVLYATTLNAGILALNP